MGMCKQALAVLVTCSFGALAACGQATPDKSVSDPKPAPTSAPTPTASSSPPPPATPPATPTSGAKPPPQTPQGAPRLIAPLSTSISTSTRPMFSWIGESATAPATVDVCRDRACQDPIVSFAATGSSAQPPQPLPAGVVFWRVSSATSGGRTSSSRLPGSPPIG